MGPLKTDATGAPGCCIAEIRRVQEKARVVVVDRGVDVRAWRRGREIEGPLARLMAAVVRQRRTLEEETPSKAISSTN